MIEALIDRLAGEISELSGRVKGAAELAELTRTNGLPQHGTSAFVIPLGLVGRAPEAGAGAFLQTYEDTFGVVLILRNHTPAGQTVLANLRDFLMRVVNAIAGWAPQDELGVFRLARGSIVSSSHGTMIYQIDFSITDQLRIFS